MKLTTEQIKNAIQEHENKIQELQEQLKKSSYVTGFERAKGGEEFSFVCSDGEKIKISDIGYESDDLYFDIANYGQEKRMSLLEKMNRLQRLMYRFSAENGGDEIDWSDNKQKKWTIGYDYSKKEIKIYNCSFIAYNNTIHFTSEEAAEQALEKFRPLMEEIIKEEQEVKEYYLMINSDSISEKIPTKFEMGRKFIIDGLIYEIYHIEETENGTEYHIEHDEGDDDKYLWDIHTESELEQIILRGSFNE